MPQAYYVYIITNRPNGILYIGMTNDLSRRLHEHKNGLLEGFSKKYALKRLVYYESYATPGEAIQAEKRMKHWSRAWKVRRILQMNPEWNDLYETIN